MYQTDLNSIDWHLFYFGADDDKMPTVDSRTHLSMTYDKYKYFI